jgi:hypothetical protein
MGLIDTQVVISASNITDQLQSQYIQGVQAAQSQSMLRLQRDSDLKNDQVTEPADKDSTTSIHEKNDNTRQWKREGSKGKKTMEAGPETKSAWIDPDHIIDIKA